MLYISTLVKRQTCAILLDNFVEFEGILKLDSSEYHLYLPTI